jgi:nucleoside-diphosphate-sugar epimerase
MTAERRGAELLEQLSLSSEQRVKFGFVVGDVELPRLGIEAKAAESLRRDITHVVHCAANVAFDDTYERSFKANVVAARNALRFSRWLQNTSGSRFVAHIAVGTSYLHGRCGEGPVQEESLFFPAGGFNNYYELTKAMAALETRRASLRYGLRAVELCPAIVIGEQRTGNNRGDTKVINAPVNFLGRTRAWIEGHRSTLWTWLLAPLATRMALCFPSDPDAAMNLVTVDWVGRAVLAALKQPQAVARRIHLASGSFVTARHIAGIIEDEIAVDVRLSDPRVHRRFVLPLVCTALQIIGREKTARRLHRLGSVFAGYSDRGQPLHAVANDVAVLGLPSQRPDMIEALRMLCRHNEWVQEFGAVQNAAEIVRRETAWADLIERIERRAHRPAGSLGAGEFRDMLSAQLGSYALNAKALPQPEISGALVPV